VLAGAAAQALGYLGLVRVPLPGLEAAAAAAAAAAATAASGSNGSSEEPPLLRLLFGLAGSKDSRTVLRAVTAVGYIGAGSSSQELKMAAAKGVGLTCFGLVYMCCDVVLTLSSRLASSDIGSECEHRERKLGVGLCSHPVILLSEWRQH
jgi:hypothetical protein